MSEENIVIRNPLGQEVAYGEYDNVVLTTSDGNQVSYSKLPPVSSEDNGMVLGVSNGAWGKVEVNFEEVNTNIDSKMDKQNPIGSGSFSMNRKANTIIGTNSHTEGYNGTASGNYSHAEGFATAATGYCSHTEGINTIASNYYGHAEGYGCSVHGDTSHAEGCYTIAGGKWQHVQGKYNINDTANKYVHIVGNGTALDKRSNAHTVDWNGTGWYAGGLQVGGAGQDLGDAKKVLLEGEAIPIPAVAQVGQVPVVKRIDENGKPVEWEMSKSSETPDWNQNNELASNFIKNRPFYIGEVQETIILPSTQVPLSFPNEQDISAYGLIITPTLDQILAWKSDWTEAKIVWDGTEYNCLPKKYGTLKYIGNLDALIGIGDTGEPFAMGMDLDGSMFGNTIALIYDTSTEIPEDTTSTSTIVRNIELSISGPQIKKIDSKFIENIDFEEQIINKPFGKMEPGAVIFNQTIISQNIDGMYGSFIQSLGLNPVTYNIVWDENLYTCVAKNDGGTIIIGNQKLLEEEAEDTGEPFLIADSQLDFAVVFTNDIESKAHSLSVVVIDSYIKKIDSQYLPDLLPEVSSLDDGKVLKVSNGVWSIENETQELPSVTSIDAGKFLRVDSSGTWVAESIPNAAEVEF